MRMEMGRKLMGAANSLPGRVALTISVLALAIVMWVSWLQMSFVKGNLREQGGEHLYQLVAQVADDLDDKLSARMRALNAYQQSAGDFFESHGGLSQAVARRFFEQSAGGLGNFDAVAVLDVNGRVIADHPSSSGRSGLDASHREYYLKAREQMKTVVSDPFVSALGGRLVFAVSTPIVTRSGETIGFIAGFLELKDGEFFESVKGTRIGRSGYFTALTESGTVILHPNSKMLMKKIGEREKSEGLRRALGSGWQGWGQSRSSSGSMDLVSYKRLKRANWVLGGVIPMEEAEAPARRIEDLFFIIALACAGTFAAVVGSFVSWQMEPLRRLRESLEASRGLDRARRIEAQSNWSPDMANLARAYNELIAAKELSSERLKSSESFFKALAELSPEGVFVANGTGRLLYANPIFLELMGVSADQLDQCDPFERVETGAREQARELWESSVAKRLAFSSRLALAVPGRRVEVMVSAQPAEAWALGEEGVAGGLLYVGVASDISERANEERRLKFERDRAQRLMEAVAEGLLYVDGEGRIESSSEAARRLLGKGPEELRGLFVCDALSLADEASGEAVDCVQMLGSERVDSDRWTLMGPRGPLPVEISWRRMDLASKEGVIAIRDVRERREGASRARWEASHDPLTGLLNRRGFDQALEEGFASRATGAAPGGALMVDLDNLKAVNDTRGHEAGDEAIKRAGEALRESLGKSAVVSRRGGDEFCALLPEVGAKELRAAAESARAAIESAAREGAPAGSSVVGVSIGLSLFEARDKAGKQALRRADQALYEAKRAGKGRVVERGAARAKGAGEEDPEDQSERD